MALSIRQKIRVGKLEKQIRRYPEDCRNYLTLATILEDEGEVERARDILLKLGRKPLSVNDSISVNTILGRLELRLEQAETAYHYLSSALAVADNANASSELYGLLGESQLLLSMDNQELLVSFRKAVEFESSVEKRWQRRRRLFEVLLQVGELSEVESLLSNLITDLDSGLGVRIDPEEQGRFFYQAADAISTRSSERALVYYQRAVNLDSLSTPLMSSVYIHMAEILTDQEDVLGAIEKYEMALRYLEKHSSRERASVLLAMAELYEAMDRADQIYTLLSDVVSDLAIGDPIRFKLLRWLSEYHIEQQEYPKALEIEDTIREELGGGEIPRSSHRRMGIIWAGLGNDQASFQELRRYRKESTDTPDEADAAVIFAEVQLHRGKLREAMQEAELSLKLNPEYSARALYTLGEANLQQDNIIASLRAYLRVVEENPGSHWYALAFQRLREIRRQLQDEDSWDQFEITEVQRVELNNLLDIAQGETDLIQRLRRGLQKTQVELVGNIEKLLARKDVIDENILEELEEILILADLGIDTTQHLIERIKSRVKRLDLLDADAIRMILKEEMTEVLRPYSGGGISVSDTPTVILMVGVNGVGKTTTIAKLTRMFQDRGESVLLAAGDTFRAGAIEQIEEWGRRLGVEVIKQAAGADPSAVAYDALTSARARNSTVLIVDTAGRLHTKINLMEELKKVRRVLGKIQEGAPHEVILVVDATTGQNAVSQTRIFHEAVQLSGIILTKMDGTAKGGIVVRLATEFKIPVKYIGIGEQMEDLKEFRADEFSEALFG